MGCMSFEYNQMIAERLVLKFEYNHGKKSLFQCS